MASYLLPAVTRNGTTCVSSSVKIDMFLKQFVTLLTVSCRSGKTVHMSPTNEHNSRSEKTFLTNIICVWLLISVLSNRTDISNKVNVSNNVT